PGPIPDRLGDCGRACNGPLGSGMAPRARRFRFDSGSPIRRVHSGAMRRTMNDVHDTSCAVAATAEIVATKWTPLIVHDLSEGPRRFKELERACPGISPRTLSERL